MQTCYKVFLKKLENYEAVFMKYNQMLQKGPKSLLYFTLIHNLQTYVI